MIDRIPVVKTKNQRSIATLFLLYKATHHNYSLNNVTPRFSEHCKNKFRQSVELQAQYLQKQGVGGAFIWSLEMDDFRGSCGAGKYPLLTAIASVFDRQTPRRSSFVDNDLDEFFSASATRRGGEVRSRDVGESFRRRDGDRAPTRYQSSRRRERPVYTDDDDFADVDSRPTSPRDDRHHGDRSESPGIRRRQQERRRPSPDIDDVTSGRSSRRRTTLADDLSDNFRRYDDIDDDEPRSDRRRNEEVPSKRRGWSESSGDQRINEGRKPFDRDGRRRAPQDTGDREPPDTSWNDEPRTTSSTFFEDNSFTSSRRTSGDERPDRFSSGRGRTRDYDDIPVDGWFRCDSHRYRHHQHRHKRIVIVVVTDSVTVYNDLAVPSLPRLSALASTTATASLPPSPLYITKHYY